MDEVTADAIRQRMSEKEWERVYEMSQDRGLYQNLITSLFPTIHGKLRPQTGSYCRFFCLSDIGRM